MPDVGGEDAHLVSTAGTAKSRRRGWLIVVEVAEPIDLGSRWQDISGGRDAMAKGEQRGNREAKKPKKEKPKTTAAAPSIKNVFNKTPADDPKKKSGK